MDDVFKNALKTNLEARKSERRTLLAKVQVLDKQINDLEKLIKEAPATKPATKSATKPKASKKQKPNEPKPRPKSKS